MGWTTRWSVALIVMAGCAAAAIYLVWAKEQALPGPNPVLASASLASAPAETKPLDAGKPPLDTRRPKLLPDLSPDAFIVLTGQMHGYLQPCGCSRPQLGGLERRFELIQELQARAPVTAADLGDLGPTQRSFIADQDKHKFEAALQMLAKMPYAALAIGPSELAMPLDQALGRTQNYKPPVVVMGNFQDPDQLYPEMFQPYTVVETKPNGLKVAYVGLLSDALIAESTARDPALKWTPPAEALPGLLEALKEKQADLRVLLWQGSNADAKKLLEAFPQAFHVVLSRADADVAPALPTRLGPPDKETLLVNIGHKGRSVAIVGVEKQPEWPKLSYQMVDLVEGYELPDDQTNPVRELMRDYVLAVYRNDYYSRFPRSKHAVQQLEGMGEATFVGSDSCQKCHPTAYAVWHGSKHRQAYHYLVEDGRPIAELVRANEPPRRIGRQYDPDCMMCHVTGYGLEGGFISEEKTPMLLGNQCENCHGPASLHVQFGDKAKHDLSTVKKYAAPLRLTIGQSEGKCRICHDADNDPHFDLEKYWPKIKHGREPGQ